MFRQMSTPRWNRLWDWTAAIAIALALFWVSHRVWGGFRHRWNLVRGKIAEDPAAAGNLRPRTVDLSRTVLTLLIFTDPECPHCRDSAGWHGRLLAAARRQGVSGYVAVPPGGDGVRFATRLGAESAEIRSWDDLGYTPPLVPLILLLDQSGTIRGAWRGRLSQIGQDAVLEALKNPGRGGGADPPGGGNPEIRLPGQVRASAGKAGFVVLDVSERGSLWSPGEFRGAVKTVRIPLPEVGMRARRDLPAARLIVLDCTPLDDISCLSTRDLLRDMGFRAEAARAY